LVVTTIEMQSSSSSCSDSYVYDSNSKVEFSTSGGFDGFFAKGFYSKDTQNYVQTVVDKFTSFVQSNVEMQLYQITMPTITAPLNEQLTLYVNILYEMIQKGDLVEYQYWIDQFVSNVKYATVTMVITGGCLQQTQYVSDSYYESTDKSIVENCASASASFTGLFNVNGQHDWGVSTQQIETFNSYSSEINTVAIGGPYIDGMTIAEWQEAVEATPAIVQYTVSKTSFWLTTQFFPHIPEYAMKQIYAAYEASWSAYIAKNSVAGCTNKFALNFNKSSNVDDSSCITKYYEGSVFGAFFASQTVQEIIGDTTKTYNSVYANPLTGYSSCQTGFTAQCFSAFASGPNKVSIWEQLCVCQSMNQSLGMSYGGWYSTDISPSYVAFSGTNDITGAQSCPVGFTGYATVSITDSFFSIYSCLEENVPTFIYGGAYFVVNGFCTPNILTGACSCPDYATNPSPIQFQLSSNWVNPELVTITLCYGQIKFQLNPNPGNFTLYEAIQNLNVTIIPYKSSTEWILLAFLIPLGVLIIIGVLAVLGNYLIKNSLVEKMKYQILA